MKAAPWLYWNRWRRWRALRWCADPCTARNAGQPHALRLLAEDHSGSALAQAVLRVTSTPAELLQRDMTQVLAQYTPQRFASAWAHLIEQVTA